MKTLKFQAEITDLFGGEANYSWVRRATFDAPENASDRTLQCRARKALDIQHTPGRWTQLGDVLEFRPYGWHVVVFVTIDPGQKENQ